MNSPSLFSTHMLLCYARISLRRLVNTWILRCGDWCFVVFRLVYDRETGKPKGYGFCEYQDQETALSAMRNLNGREFSGRALRVDNAASEKNKEELKSKRLFRTNVLYFVWFVFAKLQICFFCLLWYRFGNRSPHHRVSLWRQHPATGSPRVHQQSCGQSAAWADVWTDETDEGRLEESLWCSSVILVFFNWHNKSVNVAFPKTSGLIWLGYSSSTLASLFRWPSSRMYSNII